MKTKYTEIFLLDKMLTDAKIPHEFRKLSDGYQVIYTAGGFDWILDAVQHHFSYGNELDLLEIMGLLTPEEEEIDSVKGFLTAAEVFDRIKRHWEARA